jgi:hypothetical protein
VDDAGVIASIFTVKTFDHFRSRVSPKRRSIVAFRTGERSRPGWDQTRLKLAQANQILVKLYSVPLESSYVRRQYEREVTKRFAMKIGTRQRVKMIILMRKGNQKANKERQEKDGNEESRRVGSSISCCLFERTGGGG